MLMAKAPVLPLALIRNRKEILMEPRVGGQFRVEGCCQQVALLRGHDAFVRLWMASIFASSPLTDSMIGARIKTA